MRQDEHVVKEEVTIIWIGKDLYFARLMAERETADRRSSVCEVFVRDEGGWTEIVKVIS